MSDLVLVDGKYHCNPKKICRMNDERVICRTHGGERVRMQMDEVSPGIFECKPHSMCFSAQPGRPVEAPRPTQPGTAVPYPVSTPHIPQRVPAQSRVEVWCCLHGTRLPEKNCDLIDDTYYVCKDAGKCLMSELETPAALRSKHAPPLHCPPILCRTHDRLREISFMRLRADKSGYECDVGHQCSTFGRGTAQ
jgi:hypothetical protein